jgi:hypothetical protein
MGAFDFAAAKSALRRVVHDTLGVDALYQDDSMSDPVAITARWHNKIDRFGDPESQGYAEIVQGIDRIGLIPEYYPDITFRRGGTVTFPAYGNAFVLQVLEPADGPHTRWWQAVPA